MDLYSDVSYGLHSLLNVTRHHTDNCVHKVETMQRVYFDNNPDIDTPQEKELSRYYLRASMYKFYLASLALEQIWSLSHTKRNEFADVLENSLDKLECSDDDLLLISYSFENFLFQGRAFLDFYMLYLCYFLHTDHKGGMSRKKFFTALNRSDSRNYEEKAIEVKKYFENCVFAKTNSSHDLSPTNWGTLLVSLRDRIAHRDRIRPSFESDETLVSKVLFDWPTIHGITYDRFYQYIQNGMFETVVNVSPIIYELDWKPGPYRSDLWQS